MKRIKNNIRKYREELGLSQEELSNRVKITRPYLSNIENGKYDPGIEVALRISQELKKPVEKIFFKDFVQHDVQNV